MTNVLLKRQATLQRDTHSVTYCRNQGSRSPSALTCYQSFPKPPIYYFYTKNIPNSHGSALINLSKPEKNGLSLIIETKGMAMSKGEQRWSSKWRLKVTLKHKKSLSGLSKKIIPSCSLALSHLQKGHFLECTKSIKETWAKRHTMKTYI